MATHDPAEVKCSKRKLQRKSRHVHKALTLGVISIVRKSRNAGFGCNVWSFFSSCTSQPGARWTFFNMTQRPDLDAEFIAFSACAGKAVIHAKRKTAQNAQLLEGWSVQLFQDKMRLSQSSGEFVSLFMQSFCSKGSTTKRIHPLALVPMLFSFSFHKYRLYLHDQVMVMPEHDFQLLEQGARQTCSNPSLEPIAMEVICLFRWVARSSTRLLASYPGREHIRTGSEAWKVICFVVLWVIISLSSKTAATTFVFVIHQPCISCTRIV